MTTLDTEFVTLDVEHPIWDQFFTIAPLVLIGTREEEGFNLAPKHMVTPLGWQNYFGFVCTPRHATYHNIKHQGVFTVSFPQPSQVLLASLSAEPRCDRAGTKPIVDALPLTMATTIDGAFLSESYLLFECELERIIDGFGQNSFIVGDIVAAHVRQDVQRASEVDEQEMLYKNPMLAYVSPGRYATVRDSIAFPFPAGFSK